MNITIDVDRLQDEAVITPDIADILRQHAIQDGGSSALDILRAAGAIAFAAGVLTLFPSAYAATILGSLFTMVGYLARRDPQRWDRLSSLWLAIGALLLSGSVGMAVGRPLQASLLGAVILGTVGVIGESSLVMLLMPLALAAALGGATGDWQGTYRVILEQPVLTVFCFWALACGAWLMAENLKGVRQRLVIAFARSCVILVNLGFWAGSVWGDAPGDGRRSVAPTLPAVPAGAFALGWAVALLLTGIWGATRGRRFVVNAVAVFGAIHFYTQWFGHLGWHALPVIVAGAVTLGAGMLLWRYNRTFLAA